MKKSFLSISVAYCLGAMSLLADNTNVEHLDIIDVFDVGSTEFQRINAPLSVSVVTAQDLEKNNYKNVNEAISSIHGVYNGGFYTHIRGIDSGTIFLIDGKPTKTLNWNQTNIYSLL